MIGDAEIVNIFVRLLFLTQQQCIDELNSIFGDEAPSTFSVYRWYGEFNRGHSSLLDEFRKGCPKSIVVPETINFKQKQRRMEILRSR